MSTLQRWIKKCIFLIRNDERPIYFSFYYRKGINSWWIENLAVSFFFVTFDSQYKTAGENRRKSINCARFLSKKKGNVINVFKLTRIDSSIRKYIFFYLFFFLLVFGIGTNFFLYENLFLYLIYNWMSCAGLWKQGMLFSNCLIILRQNV